MIVAVLLVVAFELFSVASGAGGGFTEIGLTRRGWRNLFLVLCVIVVAIAAIFLVRN